MNYGVAVTVSYCYQWNDLTRQPRDPYDEPTARERHARGELYTVLLGDPASPHTVVEMRLEAGWVGVHFLDSKLRRWSSYSFGLDDSKHELFLKQYRRADFDGAGVQTGTEIITFTPSGLLTVRKVDQKTKMVDQHRVQADVSKNWEPVPAFGQYDSIARFDR